MHIYGTSSIHGAQPINTPHHNRVSETPAAKAPAAADEVSISSAAQFLDQVRELPDVRTDRVAALRQAIASGTYETEERLSTALDRMLDEMA